MSTIFVVDYLSTSRLIVDYFSYNTRIRLRLYVQINKSLSNDMILIVVYRSPSPMNLQVSMSET